MHINSGHLSDHRVLRRIDQRRHDRRIAKITTDDLMNNMRRGNVYMGLLHGVE